jgi:hypothetical protein
MSSPFLKKALWLAIILLAMLVDSPSSAQETKADSADFMRDGYILGPGENAEEKIRQNLFLKTIASRQSCYEGEAFEVEYLLFTRLSLDARVGRKTGFEGFGSIEMPASAANGQPSYQWHNGKVYKVYAIRKVQLTPLQSGMLSAGALSLDATITFLKKGPNQTDNDIDPYLPGNRSIHTIVLESPTVIINVTALPPSNNPNENGLVGQFKIEARIDSAPLVAGKLGHLLVVIQGQGQWSKVQCPPIQWPQGFQAYEPSVTEQLDSQHVPVAGQRIYRIPFETNDQGKFDIPGFSISFFNPQTQSYEKATTPPVTISVAPPESALTEETSTASRDDRDYTFAFTRWAPWFFATAAVVLVLVLLQAAVLSKSRSRNYAPAENWDRPDAGIGNVSRRLDAESGQYTAKRQTTEQPFYPEEMRQLASQYHRSVTELLQERLAKNTHKGDPLLLQLLQQGVAENHSRSIMQFLDRCEGLMQNNAAKEDAESLSTSFYEILRLIRNHV